MKSIVFKSGIIAVLFMFLHCVNDPPSKVHLVLNLEVAEQNDTARVNISTPVPEDFSYYRIDDDSCTLIVSYRKIVDGTDSTFIDTHQIANNSAGLQSGTFQGAWAIPTSLSFILLYPNTPIFFDACLKDETNHNVIASLIFYEDTTLTK